MRPSGLTGTTRDISGSFQTLMASTSSAPIKYSFVAAAAAGPVAALFASLESADAFLESAKLANANCNASINTRTWNLRLFIRPTGVQLGWSQAGALGVYS